MKKRSNSPRVSIIILTYDNGIDLVKRCLRSVMRISYPNFEVILVDNASTDKTSEFIEKKYPQIKLIKNRRNLGFCIANNRAVERAKGKYILFLNNDTEVSVSFLSKLVANLENDKQLGIVQPKIRQLKSRSKLDACASFLSITGFLYHYGYSQNESLKKYNKEMFTYSVKGACFLVRKKIIDQVGLFDRDYFAYFEETDFCHRVWLSGYKIMYEPTSVIYHLGGVGKEASADIQFHSFKNRIATYVKNLEGKTLLTILPLHVLICLFLCTMYLLRGKSSYSFAILKALFWNISNSSKLLSKRSVVQQKLRKISDSKLLPDIKKNVKLSYYKHFFLNPRGNYKFEEV